MKLDFLSLPTSNYSFDQIFSSTKLHQYCYENFYTHHTLHTHKKHISVNNKLSSPYSISPKYALNSSYIHGPSRNNDPLKDCFIYCSDSNPNRPIIVSREALLTQNPHFYVNQNQPPPRLTTQTHSFFHPYICQPIPPTALHIYIHLLANSYNTAKLRLLNTNLIYRLQTTQPPANNPSSTHDSIETFSNHPYFVYDIART